MQRVNSDERIHEWISIRREVYDDLTSQHDRRVLDEVVTRKEWKDSIPRGLHMSYAYIYHVAKGLSTHEVDVIERDVLRTVKDGYGEFKALDEKGKIGKAKAMRRLLSAISLTDGMGYCQGMNYVADFLLSVVSEEDAFCLFLHVLRNKHLCCVYETNLPVLSDLMSIYEQQLKCNLPKLAEHLKSKNFLAPFYSIEWFTTVFTLSCPTDLTIAIWDLFFSGLQDTFLRGAIAIMSVLENQLLELDAEDLLKNFRSLVSKVGTHQVLRRIFKIIITPGKVSTGELLKIPPDERGDTLLALRNHYLTQNQVVRNDRFHDTEVRTKEKVEKQKAEKDYDRSPLMHSSFSLIDDMDVHHDVENTSFYVLHFSNDYRSFDADESLMIKVAELRQVARTCERFYNVNLFMKKWIDCLSLIKSDLTRYFLADQLLRESLSTGVHIRIISFLLVVGGSDPNSQDLNLYTPLHIAALNNRIDAARLLLMCGADSNIYGALGFSSRGRMKIPSEMITNMIVDVSMNISTWPATLVLLRGKCCVHCNILIPSTIHGPVNCSHCDVTLCSTCKVKHQCVYQLFQQDSMTYQQVGQHFSTLGVGGKFLGNLENAAQPWQKLLLPFLFDVIDPSDLSHVEFLKNRFERDFFNTLGYQSNHLERKCIDGHESVTKMGGIPPDSVLSPNSLPSFLYCRDEIKESLRLLCHDAQVMLLSASSGGCFFDKFDKNNDDSFMWALGNNLGKRLVPALMYDTWKYSFNDSRALNKDLVWFCRECFIQFSVFTGKHHCLRCGSLFCNQHAPFVDIIKCTPSKMEDNCVNGPREQGKELHSRDTSIDYSENKSLRSSMARSIETVRLCKSCDFEIFHAGGVFQVILVSYS